MITLINKKNPLIKIIVPEISEGDEYIIIDKKYFNIQYLIGDIYLRNKEWNIIKD